MSQSQDGQKSGQTSKYVVVGFFGFWFGVVATFFGLALVRPEINPKVLAPAAQAPDNATSPLVYRRLDANLWVQSSAEYMAACEQAYSVAKLRLDEQLAKKPVKPLVILDLDETVIDNREFERKQIREKETYKQEKWDAYERDDWEKVLLIPGAKAFIDYAKSKGVVVVYISNRSETYRESTKRALKNLQIEVPDEQLLLKEGKSSDKTERRAKAMKDRTLLILVGDNLRDFDEKFRYDENAGMEARKDVVQANKGKFGSEWILLPNPLYGEWDKAYYGEKGLEAMKDKR